MKNEKVIFYNIDDKKLNKIDKDAKYVLFTSKNHNDIDISMFKIKPLIVSFNGTYAIDKENNKVIINEKIDMNEFKVISTYFNKHNIKFKKYTQDNKTYTVKFISENFYRMLIIPTFFQSKYDKIKTLYNYPVKIANKEHMNYLISTKVSNISNLAVIINYLGITTKNIVDLELLSTKVLDNLNNLGYCIGINSNKFVISKEIIK